MCGRGKISRKPIPELRGLSVHALKLYHTKRSCQIPAAADMALQAKSS